MKIIIIGADGFVGSHLYSKCLHNGIEAIGTSKRTGSDFIFFELGKSDAEDLLCTPDINGSDYAIIAAAIPNIKRCFEERELTYRVNVSATIDLITKLYEHGIKCVYLSSDAVFDGKKGNYTEEDTASPLNEYGRQKKDVEDYLLGHFDDVLIFRLSKQYDLNNSRRHLFSDIYRCAQNNKVQTITGLRFNPTYVGDTVGCIIEGCKQDLKGLYHLAAPVQLSRHEISKRLVSALGLNEKIIEQVDVSELIFEENRSLNTTLSTLKLMNEVNLSFLDFDKAVELFAKNEKTNGW